MPELPEVEICGRNLRRWGRGRSVVAVRVAEPRALRGDTAEGLAARLVGRAPGVVRRRGKRLLWCFDGPERPLSLGLHLGMTGKWVLRGPGAAPPPWMRVELVLDDGSRLAFRDPRLLGRVVLLPEGQAGDWLERGLGPDALDEAPAAVDLKARLGGTRSPLKVALMDQSRLAGLGNIQASEVLFEAGIRPDRSTGSLLDEEWDRLARAIPRELRRVIAEEDGDEVAYVEEGGTPNPFRVYQRQGEACPRCGAGIQRLVQGGRSTFFCPACQS